MDDKKFVFQLHLWFVPVLGPLSSTVLRRNGAFCDVRVANAGACRHPVAGCAKDDSENL